MKKRTKALFIDWNKTLSNSLFWSQLANKEHPNNSYHNPIIKWLFKQNSHFIYQWMKGDKTSEQICEMISQANNLNKNIVYKTLQESCENMKFCSPKIINLINKIRQKGTKVVIATDNMDTFRKFTINGMGLDNLFDDFLISCEKKALKYETKENKIPFFDLFLKKNNLLYEEVILIDDSDDKTGIYKKLGFKIKLIKNTKDLLSYLQKFTK